MPVIHSSPHPNKDRGLAEDAMPGNPYPNVGGGGDVEPGYDAHEWAPVSGHGRGMYPGSGNVTMSYSPRGGQAPPLATGRREFERQHSPNRHSHRQHENMNPYPMEGRYRGVSFDGRPGGRPSFGRSYSDDDEDDEDEGEWFDEENSDDEEEQVFFPPKMGRGRGRGRGRDHAWDSSDGEEFERRFDDEDEEDFDEEDEEDEEFEEAFAQPRGHFRGGMMPRRGHPRFHRGAMHRSSPPPLETPPDSPPPLSFGALPRNNMDPRMMRGRDMDPRMMRGRDMDPRMMRGRDMDPRMMRGRRMSPSMMNRGGMRNIPVRGGPPFSRGNSMRRGPVSRKRARFVESPSSTTSSDSRDVRRFQRLSGGFRPPSRSGGSIKRAMKWLTKPDSQYYTLLL